MGNFAGVSVTYDVDNTTAGQGIISAIDGYGDLISNGFDVPRTPNRDIVVMTDRAAYEQLTGNFTRGLSGQLSTKVPGQYTVFVDPSTNQASLVAVHEVMHITHPGLGPYLLHETEFYVQQEKILSELGLGPRQWEGVIGAGLYDKYGGNQLEKAIAEYGITAEQLEILAGIYTPSQLANLSKSLTNLYGTDSGLAQKYEALTGKSLSVDHCFIAKTPIQMWPTDPSVQLRDDGSYDEELVLSKVWEKPISEIRIGDLVVAYDDRGRLAPKSVTRTMTNTAKHILDFWGTGVTPGHAYFCADGQFKGQHVPLLDILRTDGTIMKSDGTQIRAATGCEVGSIHDRLVHAVVGDKQPNGQIALREQGQVRLGTRVILENGEQHCVLDILNANGAQITEDGYIRSGAGGAKVPLSWTFSKELPKPEDYILRRSKVTLEEIYVAGEWEQIGPRLPAPDGSNASLQHDKSMSFSAQKPLSAADGMRQPTRTLNRKQRKAMEAKQRKAAKAGKRLVS